MNHFLKTIFPLLLLFALSIKSFAEVKLPALFSDGMVLQQKSGVAIWGWADAGSKVTVIPSWDGKKYTTTTDKGGKWQLKVLTPPAGGPYELTISDGKPVKLKNVLIGEVWVCAGQSNMEMPMKGYRGQPILNSNEAILKSKNPNIRLFTVPRSGKLEPMEDTEGDWKMATPESVADFSATGYYFGRLLNEMLDVPIGLITVSYGGSPAEAWMSQAALVPFPEIKTPKEGDKIESPNRTPTLLFNGMLNPVIGYGIKGVIWYQGESNYDRPDQYQLLFPAMVKEWRDLWKIGEFPFYFTQIAPYNYAQLPPYHKGGKYNSAFLRDAQRKSVDVIPNSAMAVILDAGEECCIHPANKEVVGTRLAYLALGKEYGIKGFGYESPVYDTMAVNGNEVVVSFDNVPNGLTSFNKELSTFEIAGPDKVFYPAKAVLRSKSVVLSSPQVKEPVAVRYAFKDYVEGELFSTEGLPVSSFRTDDWDE